MTAYVQPRTFGDLLKPEHNPRWHVWRGFGQHDRLAQCRFCARGNDDRPLAQFSIRHYACEKCVRARHDVLLPAVKKDEARHARLAAIREREFFGVTL